MTFKRSVALPLLLISWSLLPEAAEPPARSAPPPIAAEELAARRARVLEEIGRAGGEKGVLILRSPLEAVHSGDVDFPFRTENNLYYLTGIDAPGCALLLSAGEAGSPDREVLFLRLPDPSHRIWTGEGLTAAEASRRSGIPGSSVEPLERLEERVRKLMSPPGRSFHAPLERSRRPFFLDLGRGFPAGKTPSEPYAFLLDTLGSSAFHLDLRSPHDLVLPLRQKKSAAEVALLEKAIDATTKALLRAWRTIAPGVHEFEIRAVIEGTFIAEGCRGWSFPPIVGSGPNTCILHYGRYDRRAQDGDLLLLDIGAEYELYAADVTRTVPVNGRFSPRQREVYQIVLDAQEVTIRALRPGMPYGEVNRVARAEIAAGLKRLGLQIEGGDPGMYLPHGVTHGLGLDVHDPMPVRELAPGMVITVEPGIYIVEEGIGVRIEDDVLITEDGARILSTGAPRTIDEIEAYMALREF